MAKEQRTEEEIRLEIANVELETKKLQLEEAKKRNVEFRAAEERRHTANRKRMEELASGQRNWFAIVKACRHQSGGNPKNVLRGGGSNAFSVLSRTIMPDGMTIFVQCPRCRLKMHSPERKNRQLWFKDYAAEKAYFDKLLEASEEKGLGEASIIKGPTFMFQKINADGELGPPFIPERV